MDCFNHESYTGRSDGRNAFLYTLASSEYFEPLEKATAIGDYQDLLRNYLPRDWVLKKAGLWYHGAPSESVLPSSGFKLHLSATLDNAERILSIVAPICIAERVTFKVIQSANLLAVANSKFFPRAAAHKFITIYPGSTDQFIALSELLNVKTQAYAGPYILSDKAVRDSKVLFYRFGGFLPVAQLTVQGGKRLLIQAPDGRWIDDLRVPYFRLPDGVTDPLASGNAAGPAAQVVLHSRYQIIEVITFSNCGGTYVAKDLESGEEVLVKEARPLATLSHIPKWRFYAKDAMLREQRILKKLSSLACVPDGIECFAEAGHTFSAQQFIQARPFRQYRAQDNIALIPFDGDGQKADQFCHAFCRLGSNLIRSVLAVHRRRVIIGDISPGNILVDDSQDVYLVDFESAWDRSWSSQADELSSVWMTPGFSPGKRSKRRQVSYQDDWYAVGMVLFSMLLPVSRLNSLSPGAHNRFLDAIITAAKLPAWVARTIRLLTEARPQAALKILESHSQPGSLHAKHSRVSQRKVKPIDALALRELTTTTVSRISAHILASCDLKRQDRLWPSDYKVFSTNPLSIAYGAAGPLLFLKQNDVEIPHKIDRWFCQQPVSLAEYPPGLYLGLAGVAYTHWQIGHKNRAVEALRMAFQSELLYNDWGMFYGAAGCGLVSLQMYLWTNDELFLHKAIEIGIAVINNARQTEHGVAWQDSLGEKIVPGFAYGASGVALFLLYLSLISQDKKFLGYAKKALEHEIGSISSEYPASQPRWTMDGKPGVWTPYWLQGGCGIGSTMIRFYTVLGDDSYLALARSIARANYSRFAVLSAQFEGLAGVGELMLDISMCTGEREFEDKAQEIVESIHLYQLKTKTGVAFPGRYLSRISHDFGYGSSGVGMFLGRFLNRGKRLLHDLDGL